MTSTIDTEFARQAEPITAEQAMRIMPDAQLAIAAARERAGEAYSSYGIAYVHAGMIADDPEPVHFYQEWYVKDPNNKDIYLAIKDPTIESGEYHIGLGKENFPTGRVDVEAGSSMEVAMEHDFQQRVLVLGSRACGAYAIGKALKEKREERGFHHGERNIFKSTGLGFAATLKDLGVDWRPNTGNNSLEFNKAIAELRKSFVAHAIMEIVVDGLILGPNGNYAGISGRATLFDFEHEELKAELLAGLPRAIEERHRATESMEYRYKHWGSRADVDAYISDGISNILTNILGIPPTET